MARSYGAVKVSVWEVGSEFRNLTPAAQWGYMMLISQPQLNNLGVLPYAPEKWHRLAAGMTPATLRFILAELATNRYIVVDEDTDELLVRTFVKHDKVWAQPKLVTNARRLIWEVESEVIRETLTTRHPWLLDDTGREEIEVYETTPALWKERPETPSDTPSHTPSHTPSDRGIGKPLSEPLSDTPFPEPPETPIETPIPTRAPAGPGPGPGRTTSVQEKTKGFTEASYAAPPGDDPDREPAAGDEPPPATHAGEQPSDLTPLQIHPAYLQEHIP